MNYLTRLPEFKQRLQHLRDTLPKSDTKHPGRIIGPKRHAFNRAEYAIRQLENCYNYWDREELGLRIESELEFMEMGHIRLKSD